MRLVVLTVAQKVGLKVAHWAEQKAALTAALTVAHLVSRWAESMAGSTADQWELNSVE